MRTTINLPDSPGRLVSPLNRMCTLQGKMIQAICAWTTLVDELLPELAEMSVLNDPDGPLDDTVPAKRPITLRDLLTFTFGTGMVPAEPGKFPIADALKALGEPPPNECGRVLAATTATWEVLAGHASHDRAIRGNLVPDAYMAALAVSHVCRLATADRGFARFPDLDFFDPAVSAPDRP